MWKTNQNGCPYCESQLGQFLHGVLMERQKNGNDDTETDSNHLQVVFDNARTHSGSLLKRANRPPLPSSQKIVSTLAGSIPAQSAESNVSRFDPVSLSDENCLSLPALGSRWGMLAQQDKIGCNTRTHEGYLLKRENTRPPLPSSHKSVSTLAGSYPAQSTESSVSRFDSVSPSEENCLSLPAKGSRWEMMAHQEKLGCTSLPSLPIRHSETGGTGNMPLRRHLSLPENMRSLPYENSSVSCSTSSSSSAHKIFSSICSASMSDSVTISTFSHQSTISASTNSSCSVESSGVPRPTIYSPERRAHSERVSRTCFFRYSPKRKAHSERVSYTSFFPTKSSGGSNQRSQLSIDPSTPTTTNRRISASVAAAAHSRGGEKNSGHLRYLPANQEDLVKHACHLNITC